MATLSKLLAASVAAVGIGSGCIVDDCLDTYFFDDSTRTVSIEPEFTERVRDISLTMEARNNSYDYKGEYTYAENLKVICKPSAPNNCAMSWIWYEYLIDYIDEEGNRKPLQIDDKIVKESSCTYDVRIPENSQGGKIECIIWSPECATDGYVEYINGVEHFVPTEWRQRSLVGSVTAEVGLSLVCPAPIPPFKPVSEDEWRQSSEDEL